MHRSSLLVFFSVLAIFFLTFNANLPARASQNHNTLNDRMTKNKSVLWQDGFEKEAALANWTFYNGKEFPGAFGGLKLKKGRTNQGAWLHYQFPENPPSGKYVAAIWSSPVPVKTTAASTLSFWASIPDSVMIQIRLVDESGQTLQYTPYNASLPTLEQPATQQKKWEQHILPLNTAPRYHWGGSNNGRLSGTITSISIVAEKISDTAQQGSVGLDDIQIFNRTAKRSMFTLQPDTGLHRVPSDAASLSERLGINIHFTDPNDPALDIIRNSGFSFVRMDLFWEKVEKSNRYDFSEYDGLLTALESRGLGALWILDYSHHDHGGPYAPRTEADIAAFAAYAKAAARYFKGRNVIGYEIWNEPNIHFWKPKPNARDYGRLLQAAALAIHQADPNATVVSGGLSKIDMHYCKSLFPPSSDYDINAVGFHPYRHMGPETIVPEWLTARNYITKVLSKDIPLWETEWGYPSCSYFAPTIYGDGHAPAARKRQAVLGVRRLLTGWAMGITRMVWYDIRDDGPDPNEIEHNFGLIDQKNKDKPAMTAVRTLNRFAKKHSYTGLLKNVPKGLHAMRLDGTKNRIFVIWSDHDTIRLHYPQKQWSRTSDMFGHALQPRSIHPNEHIIDITESDGPVYIEYSY